MLTRAHGVCANCSDCCRPIYQELEHVPFTRLSFVEDTVVELERSHPDAIAPMLLVAHTVFPVNSDGVGIGPSSGKVRLTAACSSSDQHTLYKEGSDTECMAQVSYQPWAMAGLTHVFANNSFAMATPAAYSIGAFDMIISVSQPLTHELPWIIMDIIAADPTSSIAVKYRNYIKTVLLPLCRRVTGILRAHSAAIEVCCQCHDQPRKLAFATTPFVFSPHHRCPD